MSAETHTVTFNLPYPVTTLADDDDDTRNPSSPPEGDEEPVPQLTTLYTLEFIALFLLTFGSMVLYFVDSASDVYVAWGYYKGGDSMVLYFVLTALFVIVPGIIVAGFSALLFMLDRDVNKKPNPTRTSLQWIVLCTVFSALQLGPILRDVETMFYKVVTMKAVMENNRTDYNYNKKLMKKEESDAVFLRLFERFMEAAPQVTLQLFVFFHHFHDPRFKFGTSDLVNIVLSLLSLSASITSLNRTSRTTEQGKNQMSIPGLIVQFWGHLFIITSRVFALAIFASTYPWLIVPLCAVHWAVMFGWLRWQESQSPAGRATAPQQEQKSCWEKVYLSFPTAVYAFIYIFVYFNTSDGPTRGKYWLYFSIILLENTVLLFSTWPFIHGVFSWVILVSYAAFFAGIVLILIYFLACHPSRKFRSCWEALKYLLFIVPGDGAVPNAAVHGDEDETL